MKKGKIYESERLTVSIAYSTVTGLAIFIKDRKDKNGNLIRRGKIYDSKNLAVSVYKRKIKGPSIFIREK